MGKRLPAAAIAAALRPYAHNLRSSPAAGKAANPPPAPLDTPRNAAAAGASSGRAEVRDLNAPFGTYEDERMPLAEVVSDCTKRWFQDALKEARAGDAAMQVLVGQMYRSGYGVNKNEHKARIWMEKASRYRSTVWKVSNKRPGNQVGRMGTTAPQCRWVLLMRATVPAVLFTNALHRLAPSSITILSTFQGPFSLSLSLSLRECKGP